MQSAKPVGGLVAAALLVATLTAACSVSRVVEKEKTKVKVEKIEAKETQQ